MPDANDRLAVPGTHERVTMTFSTNQGIWHVERGGEGFWSTGLDRALQHARAVFGVDPAAVAIRVDPVLDPLWRTARSGTPDEALEALRSAVDLVGELEMPIGVHDLRVLFDCDHDTLTELFDVRTDAASN